MSYLVSINSRHIVSSDNSIFRYPLPSVADLSNYEVAVAGIQLYNSEYNIDASKFANNSFQIEVPTAATTSTVTITLPDGYYSYADINRYIQRKLVEAGAYLVDADSNNVFYIQISENSTYYACQVDLASTPITLPSGFSRPATGLYSAGGSGLPSTSRIPRLIINNSEFGKVIGFNTATYPASPTTTSTAILSNITPTIHPTTVYTVRTNLVNNALSNPPDLICSFDKSGASIGELVSYRPSEFIYLDVSLQYVNEITIQICDQNFNTVKFRDNNVLITLLFKQKNKNG